MTREREPWSGWDWLGWAVITGLAMFASGFAAWFILFGDSTTCDETPSARTLHTGLHHLLVGTLTVGAVWLLAALLTRRWGAMVLSALACVAPFALAAATHRHVADWAGGLCF